MAVVVDVTSMDFPDGAQRFNWCACQSAEKTLARRLGSLPRIPVYPLGQLPAPTPIVDFSFWSDLLSGGGGTTEAPPPQMDTPPVAGVTATVQGNISGTAWLFPAALVIGLVWLWSSRKGGRRR